MLEGQTDVTQEPSPASEPSAPSQEATPTQEATPAEAQKTETQEPGPIPYARFKEVNEQLKSLKDSQDWQGYQKLKEFIDKDPAFAQHFVQSVNGYFTKTPEAKPDPYAAYPAEIAEPLRKTQVLEQAVQTLMQQNQYQQAQAVYSQYMNRFNEKATEMKIPDHWKDLYKAQVEQEAGKLNPNALSGYDQKILDSAFEAVHNRFEQIRRAERGIYVKEKTNDQVPASSRGAPATTTQGPLKNNEQRTSMVLELLKAGQGS